MLPGVWTHQSGGGREWAPGEQQERGHCHGGQTRLQGVCGRLLPPRPTHPRETLGQNMLRLILTYHLPPPPPPVTP